VLTLTRRIGESLLIGGDIEVTVVSLSRGRVRLGIRAPRTTPIHRRELVDRVCEENRRALAQTVEQGVAAGAEIRFPDGLLGLREHDAFVLCDLAEDNPIRCLVSCRDPNLQLYVVEAQQVFPDYPVVAACEGVGDDGEELAVGLIVRVPSDGSPPTANLAAPLVIGLESRVGRQVLLDGRELSTSAPIGPTARAVAQ